MKNHSCQCEGCTCTQCICGPYAKFFLAISNQNRLKILDAIIKDAKNVGQLADETDMEQSAVSHALKQLDSQGLVYQRREGKYVYYAAVPTVKELFKIIDPHLEKHSTAQNSCGCCR